MCQWSGGVGAGAASRSGWRRTLFCGRRCRETVLAVLPDPWLDGKEGRLDPEVNEEIGAVGACYAATIDVRLHGALLLWYSLILAHLALPGTLMWRGRGCISACGSWEINAAIVYSSSWHAWRALRVASG